MWKTLGKTTWDEIKIGEVFASKGCWEIYYKISETEAVFLTDDWSHAWEGMLGCHPSEICTGYYILRCYKLPKYIQNFYLEV